MDVKQLTEEQQLAEIRARVNRYLSYGWEWRMITNVVNYYFCTSYTVEEMLRRYITTE